MHSSVGRQPMSAQPRPYSSDTQKTESRTEDTSMDTDEDGDGSGIEVGVGDKLVLILGNNCCVFRVSSWGIFKII